MVQFPTKEELEKGTAKSQTEADKTVELSDIEKGVKKAKEQVSAIQAGITSLAEIDTSLAPSKDTGAGDISAIGTGLVEGQQQSFDQMTTLIETLTKQSEEAAKRAETASKGLLSSITKRQDIKAKQKSTKDIYKEALAEFGFTPESQAKVKTLMGQLTTYNQQLADLEAQKQAALGRNELRGGQGMDLMNITANRISRQYNSEIAAKAAQAGVVAQSLEMERGLMQDAEAMATKIVSLATYDQQQEVADIEWAMDTYKDLYDMATAEEQSAWNKAYTLAKNKLTQDQNDLTAKLNMNTAAAQAGINMGWDVDYMKNHSVEDLNAEYTRKVATQASLIGTGLTSETVGGFTVLKDAAGNIISTKATPTGEGSKKMSLVDIDRANKLYGISLAPGTTWDEMELIVGEMMVPKEWTTNELTSLANIAFSNNEDYDTVIAEINANEQILNKDEAIAAVNKAYGKIPTTPKTQREREEAAGKAGAVTAATLEGLGPAADKIVRWIKDKYKLNMKQAIEFYKGMFNK